MPRKKKTELPEKHENTPEYYTEKAALTRREHTLKKRSLLAGKVRRKKSPAQMDADITEMGQRLVLLERGLSKIKSKKPPKNLNEILAEKLEYHSYDANRTNAEMIVDRLLNEAIVKRNLFAIRDIFDRTLGKVVEKHKLEGSVPVQLVFAPFDERKPLPAGGQVVTVEARELIDAAHPGASPENSPVHADFSEDAGQPEDSSH